MTKSLLPLLCYFLKITVALPGYIKASGVGEFISYNCMQSGQVKRSSSQNTSYVYFKKTKIQQAYMNAYTSKQIFIHAMLGKD